MRRIWTWTTPDGATIRLAGWGHYGRPVLWLGPGAPDHLQLERYELVEALRPLLEQGRMKLYATDANLADLGGQAGAVLDRVHEDCGSTTQGFGLVAGDDAATVALTLAAAFAGDVGPRVDRVLLLDPWLPEPGDASSGARTRPFLPPRVDLVIHALDGGSIDLSRLGAGARRFHPGDVRPPGWARWRADLPALLGGWLEA